jgi:TPR repeat protein
MAFSLFQKGAEKGQTPSILWEGVCFHDGLGVKQDKARAVSLFREALSRGLPEAAEVLKIATEQRRADWVPPMKFQATPTRADDTLT